MALADRLAERSDETNETCSLARLIATLEGDELAALKVMLGTPEQWGWTAPEVYEALKAEGHTVGFKVINQHRSSPPTCRCARAAK